MPASVTRSSATRGFAPFSAAVLLAAVLFTGLQPVRSPDYFHHLAAGRWVATTGRPAGVEVFSHTAWGRRWIQFEWLAQWLLYLGHRAFGPDGLILQKALLVALGYGAAWAAARRRGGEVCATLVLGAAAVAAAPRSFVRPEMFSWPLMGVFVWGVERARRDRFRTLALLPALAAVWANLHGMYAGALGFLGAVCAGETLKLLLPGMRRAAGPQAPRRVTLLWTTFAACALATWVNPYGPDIWQVPLHLVRSREVGRVIAEWQPTDLSTVLEPRYYPIWVLLVVVVVTARRLDLTDGLVVAAFAFLAVGARRQIALLAFVGAPVLARHLRLFGRQQPLLRRAAGRTGARAAAVLLIVPAVCLGMGAPRFERVGLGIAWHNGNYPVQAAEFLARHHLTGNLFNTYRFGNYLIWRLYPANRVFIDGRVDVYGDEILAEYGDLLRAGPGWEARLDARAVRAALLARPAAGDPPLALLEALWTSPRWALVYWDDVAMVFLRRGGRPPAPWRRLVAMLPGGRLVERVLRRLLPRNRVAGAALPPGERALRYRPDTFTTRGRSPATLEKAMAEFRYIRSESSDCLTAHDLLAACLEALGRFDEALPHYRRVVEARPRSGAARCNLGRCLLRLGRIAEAEEHLRAALRLGGPDVRTAARRNLGNARFLAGDYAGAAKYFERLVTAQPRSAPDHRSLAAAYERLGRRAEALRHWREALRLNPADAQARRRIRTLEDLRRQRHGP